MTAIIGNDGSVTWITAHGGAAQANLLRVWRCQFSKTIVEVTGFADSNLRRNRGGLLGISGSAAGAPDDAASSDPGPGAIAAGGAGMTLLCKTAKSYAFTALMSVIGFDVDKNGENLVTYEFVNGDSDTLTETW